MRSVVKSYIFIYKDLFKNMFHNIEMGYVKYNCVLLFKLHHSFLSTLLNGNLCQSHKDSLQLCLFQEVKLYKNAREREK